MKNLKNILLGFSLMGLLAACSSEDNSIPGTVSNNSNWEEIEFSMGVEQGKIVSSRAIGELDALDLPRGEYPQTLGIYMHKYSGDAVAATLTLNEDGVNNGGKAKFYYRVNGNNTVSLKSTPDSPEEIVMDIVASGEKLTEQDLFFFASQKKISNVEYPVVKDNQYADKFKDAREEFGDKLFSTDGYVFQRKDANTIGLYLIVRNSIRDNEVKEIKEIESWQQGDWDITMKRLTSCVSIRLMLIDKFEHKNGTTELISIDSLYKGIPYDSALVLTNRAFLRYVEEKHPDLADKLSDFNVENILVRKKVLNHFPIVYDWANGVIANEAEYRKPLYLCNLNYPAWIDNVVYYEHGSNIINGLTATCDNEPFVAADGQSIYDLDLVLFMGIGQRDKNDEEQGGTYNKLITYTIPFGDTDDIGSNPYSVKPNTHTYIYVGITLENIVELYTHLNGVAKKATSDIANITISPEQVIVTSEPYITE